MLKCIDIGDNIKVLYEYPLVECYTDDWDSGAWKHATAITVVEYATKLENEIEEIGDLFPTFSGTYPEVMNILLDQRRQMEFVLPIMESALDSPSYQYRIKKIKHKNKVKAWKKTKGFGLHFRLDLRDTSCYKRHDSND